MKGAEALARLLLGDHSGIVAPDAFLGLLEDNDDIGELTWIGMLASCDCRDWREAGMDINVSVNLSVKQLSDTAIADAVTWQVTSQGLDPRHMILQTTEIGHPLMTDVGHVLQNLARLRMKETFGLLD